MRIYLAVLWLMFIATVPAFGRELDSLIACDGTDPWAPHTTFPKFVTPQWIGEPGVEAVVVLAIDDMRDSAVYEKYLRPILDRLKEIGQPGAASIMTCRADPADPQLQAWLKEGLSIDVHTFDHPCPCLQGGQLTKAKETVDQCIDLLFTVPNNRPVCYRMPCCDSINSVSPRFFTEIFNKTTPAGNFLELDSSVFMCFTPADPSLPRDMLFEADGTERFRKYIPKELPAKGVVRRNFCNIIENYPYPYLIGNRCWEMPCMVPSDWSAQFLRKPNHPDTVNDWKIALDLTVQKQGVFNLVYHPHNWIKPQQVVELIDHAVAKHGNKVKFLSFREVRDRLVKHATAGESLRDARGNDNGVRLVDVNGDGFQDVIVANAKVQKTRIWQPKEQRWTEFGFPFVLADGKATDASHFGHVKKNASLTAFEAHGEQPVLWHWQNDGWQKAKESPAIGKTFRLIDLDGDDFSDVVTASKSGETSISFGSPTGEFTAAKPLWPREVPDPQHAGVRFVDIDEDGGQDIVFSDAEKFSIHLWKSRDTGWELLRAGKHADVPAEQAIPPIVRADGTNNGFFVRQKTLCWQNEDSAAHPDLIWRRTFAELLQGRWPTARSPQSSFKSMRPRPGTRVELFAAEPDVFDPIALDWGPDGKVWVVEMADYPNGIDGQGKPGGRIRCLVDRDGDGHADQATLFAEGLRFPTGVIAWKKGVLVTAAPEILYLTDTNGDGQADQQEVLYRGFTEGNQQHRINGFARGLDGWLYLANGDSGGTITSVKTGETVELRGRDLRIHPETGRLQTCAGQAQYGRNRDDWGHWFGCNNSRPTWHYVLDDRYLKRNPHFAATAVWREVPVVPGNAPIFPTSQTLLRFNDFHTANRFTSACAVNIIRDDRWSGQQGNSLVCEPVHNLVHWEVLRPQGTSFVSERVVDEQQSEFLTSTDSWFRPTTAKTGPDGAIWITDMYRLVIEHPQWIPQEWQQKLDVRAGSDRGRIWRMIPTETKLTAIPQFDQLSTAELVALLASGNGTVRDLAQELIVERRPPDANPLLKNVLQNDKSPQARLHALWCLQLLEGLDHESLVRALRDSHPGVRRNGIILCEGRKEAELETPLKQLASDLDPHVRMQLALSLGSIPVSYAGEILVQLITTTEADPWLRGAILSSLNRENLPQVVAGVLKGKSRSRWVADLIGQAAAMQSTAATSTLLTAISQQANDEKSLAPWQALEQFQIASQRNRGEWLAELSYDAQQQWKTLRQLARQRVAEETLPPEVRAAALSVLGYDPRDRQADAAIAQEFLSPREAPELQAAALQVLARAAGDQLGTLLVSRWRALGTIRAEAGQLLLRNSAAVQHFLQEIEAEKIDRSLVDLSLRQRLLEHNDPKIRTAAAKLLSVGSSQERLAAISAAVAACRQEGDQTAGGNLFRQKCAVCHRLGDVGFAVGPDLASLTDKSPEALLTAILDPNRAVEAKYLNYLATLENGQTHPGLLAAENSTSITLRGAEAKEVALLRSDIDQLIATNKSMMPEGFQQDLSPTQLAHLIAFIRANVPLPKRKEFAGNQPAVVTPDAMGKLKLLPQQAEIYGSTLKFEEKHHNLGWWSSLDDEVHWRISVPQTGKYRVSWEWSCAPAAAGHPCRITGGKLPLVTKVKSTGSWETFQTEEIGVLELTAGEQRLIFRAERRPLPALMDLRTVTLTPERE